MQIGQRVRHTDIPPFEGIVFGIQENVNAQPSIMVESLDGRMLQDYESAWEPMEEVLYYNGRPVIDVEYEEIIEDELEESEDGQTDTAEQDGGRQGQVGYGEVHQCDL